MPSMHRRFTLSPLAIVVPLSLGAMAALTAPVVLAAQAVQTFHVPAGNLTAQLARFAQQAGIELAGNAQLTDGKTGPTLEGDYSVDAALTVLLSGAGLAAERQANGSYTLVVRGEMEIGATEIDSSSDVNTSYQPAPPTSSSILRSDKPTLGTAQVVNVVPTQVLRDQKPRNLDDALANISGITQGNTLASTQDTIMKRGFGGNRDGSVMHNGMPLVQGRGYNAAADSVEVLKGPSSLLYGIMDPGGVINVVSKRPSLQSYNAITARASGYAHDRDGSGGTLDSTGPIGDTQLAYRLIVDYEDEDYWRNFGTHRESLVAPSLAWYGDSTQVVLSYEHREFLTPFDRGTALDNSGHFLKVPRTERLDDKFNVMEGRSDLTQLVVDHQFDDNWKGHFGYSWNRETYDANQLRIASIANNGAATRSNDATHGAVSTDSYANANMEGTVEVAGFKNDLQFGVDSEKRKIYRADLLRETPTSGFNVYDPVYGQLSPSSTVSASDSDQTDKLRAQSLFLQDALHLTDKWTFVLGGRYQMYDQLAGRGRPFKANTDLNGQKFLPRAGLVYQMTDSLALYGSYTESLKPTSTIAGLTSGGVVDSSVAPEEAKSYEIGAKLDIPGRITGTLALFDIDKKNVLVSQFNDVTKVTDWRTSGAARSRGLELDVTGELTDTWSLIGSYAYLDAVTTKDPAYQGNRLWNTARETASLSAVHDFGNLFGGDRLRMGAGAHYVGERPGDSANSFYLPSYTTADAFASYDTHLEGHKLNVQLNVKNLFDRTYYTSSVNRYFISMGDTRQFILSTTLEF